MKILLSGSSGFVGQPLQQHLSKRGHEVTPLIRSRSAGDGIYWNPETSEIEAEKLSRFDAVIHLAGENIAKEKWSNDFKDRFYSSRIGGTELLVNALKAAPEPPKVFLCASAIGFYGNRGSTELDDDSSQGRGFLADTAKAWEGASERILDVDARLVNLRFGVIFHPSGGALKKMLRPFRLGLGGVLGSGAQYMSWVSLDDAVAATVFCLENDSLEGPVNIVSPQPVTNVELTRVLGWVLRRPTIFPVPAFVLRLVMGEMADELLLASTRVLPAKLLEAGYEFQDKTLEEALKRLLR